LIKGLPNNLVSSNRYIVRFAENEREVKEAQRLRFEVFNLELGEGLPEAYEDKLDSDKFDVQCHHLLVIDKKSDRVIGTYRMQTYGIAQKQNGFYTAAEFDLSSIPGRILKESAEVGRACIDREHRNGRVLFLLWRGLAAYMNKMDVRYLFGCCSINSQNPEEAWEVMAYLRDKDLVHHEIKVDTTQNFSCPVDETNIKYKEETELPQLFRLYMDMGARVCSPPAIDREFRTIDYLVLIDKENLDERTKMLFFK